MLVPQSEDHRLVKFIETLRRFDILTIEQLHKDVFASQFGYTARYYIKADGEYEYDSMFKTLSKKVKK